MNKFSHLDLQLSLFFEIEEDGKKMIEEARGHVDDLLHKYGPSIREITQLLFDDSGSNIVWHISIAWGGHAEDLINKVNMIHSFLVNCLLDDSSVYINHSYDEQYDKYISNFYEIDSHKNKSPCMFFTGEIDHLKRLNPEEFLEFCKYQIKKEKIQSEEDEKLFEET